jgi:hypothetical protein
MIFCAAAKISSDLVVLKEVVTKAVSLTVKSLPVLALKSVSSQMQPMIDNVTLALPSHLLVNQKCFIRAIKIYQQMCAIAFLKLHKNYTEQRSIALFIGTVKSQKLIRLLGVL